MTKMNTRVYLTCSVLILCFSGQTIASVENDKCESHATWSEIQNQPNESTQSTQSKDNSSKLPTLIMALDSSKIKLGQPFSFKVELCNNSQKEASKPDRITADAIMPAHQHGMNYTPKISFNEESQYYEISGFLFHMPGEWEITISSYYADNATHYTKLINLD